MILLDRSLTKIMLLKPNLEDGAINFHQTITAAGVLLSLFLISFHCFVLANFPCQIKNIHVFSHHNDSGKHCVASLQLLSWLQIPQSLPLACAVF